MNIFDLRQRLIEDYGSFIGGFLKIRDRRLDDFVRRELDRGVLWPEPWISLNPSFAPGGRVDDLVGRDELHPECARIFQIKSEQHPTGPSLRLHRHQSEAIAAAATGDNYVLTTGTGSGKSLSYIVPIVDRVLRLGSGGAIKAIVVYPDERPGQLPGVASWASSCRSATPTAEAPSPLSATRGRRATRPARRSSRNRPTSCSPTM